MFLAKNGRRQESFWRKTHFVFSSVQTIKRILCSLLILFSLWGAFNNFRSIFSLITFTEFYPHVGYFLWIYFHGIFANVRDYSNSLGTNITCTHSTLGFSVCRMLCSVESCSLSHHLLEQFRSVRWSNIVCIARKDTGEAGAPGEGLANFSKVYISFLSYSWLSPSFLGVYFFVIWAFD